MTNDWKICDSYENSAHLARTPTKENTDPTEALGSCYVLEGPKEHKRGRSHKTTPITEGQLSISRRSRRSLSRRPSANSILAIADSPAALMRMKESMTREVATSSVIAKQIMAGNESILRSRRDGRHSFIRLSPEREETELFRKNVDTLIPKTPTTLGRERPHLLNASVAVWLNQPDREDETPSGACELLPARRSRVTSKISNNVKPSSQPAKKSSQFCATPQESLRARKATAASRLAPDTRLRSFGHFATPTAARKQLPLPRPPPARRSSADVRTPIQHSVSAARTMPRKLLADHGPRFTPCRPEARPTSPQHGRPRSVDKPVASSVLLKRLADHSRELRNSKDDFHSRQGAMPSSQRMTLATSTDAIETDSPRLLIEMWGGCSKSELPAAIPRRSLAGLSKSSARHTLGP